MMVVTPARGIKPHHRWLDTFCGQLTDITWGREAQVALETLQEGDGGAVALTLLPSWVFLTPKTDVGPKGQTHLIPVPISWDISQVVVYTEPLVGTWKINSLGVKTSGALKLRVGTENQVWEQSLLPATASSPLVPADTAQTMLKHVVSAGNEAYWAATMSLEVPAGRALRKARTAISSEIHGLEGNDRDMIPPVVDDITLEQLQGDMLVTPGANTGTSVVARILEKCLIPQTFVRVEPSMWVRRALYRDAQTMLRSKIDDPHVGSRIRKLSRSLGTEDPEELLDECQRRYPTTRISLEGISRALTTGPEVTASSLALDTTGNHLLDPQAGHHA